MAITSNTLIGKTRGSIGGVTFSSWKGLNVAKSKPTSVANPNSAGQQESRRKMSFIVALYRAIALVISVGFKQMAVGQSAYNAFASANLLNGAVSDNGTAASLVPNSLQVAKGTLTNTTLTTFTADVSDLVASVEWNDILAGDQLTSDKVYAVAMKADGTILGSSAADEIRLSGVLTFPLTVAPIAGQPVHLYLFFYQPSSGKVSDSLHISANATA